MFVGAASSSWPMLARSSGSGLTTSTRALAGVRVFATGGLGGRAPQRTRCRSKKSTIRAFSAGTVAGSGGSACDAAGAGPGCAATGPPMRKAAAHARAAGE